MTARLVERDLTLTGGEHEEDLAAPLPVEPVGPEQTLPFVLRADLVVPEPPVGASSFAGRPEPGAVAELLLTLDEVDPERASGSDRTPLGARPLELRRVGSDEVDLHGGDATDFWVVRPRPRVDEDGGEGEVGPENLLVLFYRHAHTTAASAEGFSPLQRDPLWRTDGATRRHLLLAGTPRPQRGPLLIRVRHQGEADVPCPYSLLVFPRSDDPGPLVRSLLRLVGREAARTRAPFLASREFAAEVFQALVHEAEVSRDALTYALLDALGQRTREARHLALHLLSIYLDPPLAELERVRRLRPPVGAAGRGAEDRRRAQDAGLLVALRIRHSRDFRAYLPVFFAAALAEDPQLYPPDALAKPAHLRRVQEDALASLHRTVLTSVRDADQRIRLRGLAVAARLAEADLLGSLGTQLRSELAGDPSVAIQRALERVVLRGRRG